MASGAVEVTKETSRQVSSPAEPADSAALGWREEEVTAWCMSGWGGAHGALCQCEGSLRSC